MEAEVRLRRADETCEVRACKLRSPRSPPHVRRRWREHAPRRSWFLWSLLWVPGFVLVFLCCLHTGRLARMQDHKRKSAGWKISASSHLQTLRMHAAYVRTCICVCVDNGGHALAKLLVKLSRLYDQ